MPAKKQKAKQPTKGGNASEQVLELRKELDDMRARAERAESLLASSKTEVKRLRKQQDRLSLAYEDRVIELDRQKYSYEAELTAAQEELQSAKAFLEHESATHAEKAARLRGDVEAGEAVARENTRLRARVTALMREAHEQGLRGAQELQEAKAQVAATCARLEQTFRATLQRLDRERREEILASLRTESREAMRDNQRLRQELSTQASGIQQLTGRVAVVQRQLGAAKRGKELLELERTAQSQHALDLRVQAKRAEAEAETARAEAQERAAEVEALNAQLAEARLVDEERQEAVAAARRHRAEAAKWKRRALDLTRAMTFDPGSAARMRRRSAQAAGVDLAFPPRPGSRRRRAEAAQAAANSVDSSMGSAIDGENDDGAEIMWRASVAVSVRGVDTGVLSALGWSPPHTPRDGESETDSQAGLVMPSPLPTRPASSRSGADSPLLRVKLHPAASAAAMKPLRRSALSQSVPTLGPPSGIAPDNPHPGATWQPRSGALLPRPGSSHSHADDLPAVRDLSVDARRRKNGGSKRGKLRSTRPVRPVSRMHRAGLE